MLGDDQWWLRATARHYLLLVRHEWVKNWRFTSWASWAFSCSIRNLLSLFSLCSRAAAFSNSLCLMSRRYLQLDFSSNLRPLPVKSNSWPLPPTGTSRGSPWSLQINHFNFKIKFEVKVEIFGRSSGPGPSSQQLKAAIWSNYRDNHSDLYDAAENFLVLTWKEKQRHMWPFSSCCSQTERFQSGLSAWAQWKKKAVMTQWQTHAIQTCRLWL